MVRGRYRDVHDPIKAGIHACFSWVWPRGVALMITGDRCVALWGRCGFVQLCVAPARAEACHCNVFSPCGGID